MTQIVNIENYVQSFHIGCTITVLIINIFIDFSANDTVLPYT